MVLRMFAIVVGSTFALHRLSLRLDGDIDGGGRSYLRRLTDALDPDRAVTDALGRTALLAALAAVAGVAIGWLAAGIRRRLDRGGTGRDRPISGLSTGLAIAVAVPGLTWIPLYRFATDRGLVPAGPIAGLRSDPEGIRSIALWALLIGLAIAPTVTAALTGGRSWTAVGADGHPALGSLATRPSSEPVWRFGLPSLTFGLTLAVAEVVAGTGGLFDGFVTALQGGRTGDLLDLATPVVLAGALLVPVADIGAAVLRRLERPRVPGSDRMPQGRRPAMAAFGLVVLVGAAAFAGALIGPETGAIDRALADPAVGGPWFGTDEIGRSLATRTGAALGVTLLASAVPALAATVVGAGLARFRRTQGRMAGAAFGGLLDLFSWPTALVVPIAAWPLASTGRSLHHPIVLQVTGLLLVPAATRLLVRPTARRLQGASRLAATACVLTAMALSIQLLAGFVVPRGDAGWPGLGQLASAGLVGYDTSPWPVLVPLVAAVAAGTALYWLATAVAGIGDGAVASTPGPAPDLNANDVTAGDLLADDDPTDTDVEDDEPDHVGVILTDDAGRGADSPGPVLSLGEEPDGDRADDEALDIRDDISVVSAMDVPPPSDESRSIEEEASQTVELRPSDLRRAGHDPNRH